MCKSSIQPYDHTVSEYLTIPGNLQVVILEHFFAQIVVSGPQNLHVRSLFFLQIIIPDHFGQIVALDSFFANCHTGHFFCKILLPVSFLQVVIGSPFLPWVPTDLLHVQIIKCNVLWRIDNRTQYTVYHPCIAVF